MEKEILSLVFLVLLVLPDINVNVDCAKQAPWF